MATSQVEVIVWLTPSQTGDFLLQAPVTLNAAFRDPILKTLLDPSNVQFWSGVPGNLTHVTYPTAPALPLQPIVKQGVGLYSQLIAPSSCGKWMMQAVAQDASGNEEGIGTMQITVYDTGA